MTETKTLQVPVIREEITIEKRPPTGQIKAQKPVSSTENITIPIKKEELEVTKTLYVKEETVVKKKPIMETKEAQSDVE